MSEDGDNKGHGTYILEDKDRQEIRLFRKFDDLEEYFAKYPQKWDDGRQLNEAQATKIKTLRDFNKSRYNTPFSNKPVLVPAGSIGVIKDMVKGYRTFSPKDKLYIVKIEPLGYFTFKAADFEVIK